ncbi:MAG TPA: hypothetical protein VGH73_12785 [Thermoanaerobaculia bacterium]
MLNLAGSSYDFGNVLFAVLQECEHKRRALLPNEAEARLREIAREKLALIREGYEECGGTLEYWQELEREVLETALPQYIPAAAEQNRMEKTGYDVWRQGEPAARAVFGLLGLVIGALIIALPWIPIFEDAFAFLLAALGVFYPEIKKAFYDVGHSRLLNRLIAHAERYQKSQSTQFVTEAKLAEELSSVGSAPARTLTPPTPSLPSPPTLPHRERRGSKTG